IGSSPNARRRRRTGSLTRSCRRSSVSIGGIRRLVHRSRYGSEMLDGSRRRWILSTCAALAAVVVTSPAIAQRLTASYGLAHSDNSLIGTLGGYDLQLTSPRLGVVSGALSVGRHRGSHLRSGRACVGLIPPNVECPTEQLRDEATMTEVAGTLDV